MNVLEQWAQEADLEQWAHEANSEQVRSETQPVPQTPSAWDTAFSGSKYVPYFGLLGLSQWVLPPETFEKPVAEIPQGVANVIGESMFGLAPRIAKAVLPKEYSQAIPEVAGEAVKSVAEAALTPKYAPLTALSLVPGGAELAAPIFAGMGLEALPESIRALVQAETPKERVGAAVQTGLNVGMAAAPVLLRGGRAGGRVEPSATVETGAPGIPGAPRMIEGPVIDIAPAPPALPPGGRPILPPMGRQFDVTPRGAAVDVSQLTAGEIEAFRRASAFAGRPPIPARKPIIVGPPSIQPEPSPAPPAAEVPAELPAEKPLTAPEAGATETGVKTTAEARSVWDMLGELGYTYEEIKAMRPETRERLAQQPAAPAAPAEGAADVSTLAKESGQAGTVASVESIRGRFSEDEIRNAFAAYQMLRYGVKQSNKPGVKSIQFAQFAKALNEGNPYALAAIEQTRKGAPNAQVQKPEAGPIPAVESVAPEQRAAVQAEAGIAQRGGEGEAPPSAVALKGGGERGQEAQGLQEVAKPEAAAGPKQPAAAAEPPAPTGPAKAKEPTTLAEQAPSGVTPPAEPSPPATPQGAGPSVMPAKAATNVTAPISETGATTIKGENAQKGKYYEIVWTPKYVTPKTFRGVIYKDAATGGNGVVGFFGDEGKPHLLFANELELKELPITEAESKRRLDAGFKQSWDYVLSGQFAKDWQAAMEDFNNIFEGWRNAGRIRQGAKSKIQEEIELIKKKGAANATPEQRVLFTNADPYLSGTTPEKVKAYADKLGVIYEYSDLVENQPTPPDPAGTGTGQTGGAKRGKTLKEIREELDAGGQQEGGFINPQILQDIADFGRTLYRKGVQFYQWSSRMLEALGDKVLPYLKRAFDMIARPKRIPHQAVDAIAALPEFEPYNTAMTKFVKPFGAGRLPVLGRLIDPNAGIHDPVTKALNLRQIETHGLGDSIASSVHEEIKGRLSSVFQVDQAGDMNVQRTRPGQSLKMSDVFEGLQRDPTSYRLTADQRRAYAEIITPILRRMAVLKRAYGILEDPSGTYFMRYVTKMPDRIEMFTPPTRGGGPGAKQSFQKTRTFDTEQEGWDWGAEYERDVEARLVAGIRGMYKAIADKRMANNPVFAGTTYQSLLADLRSAYGAVKTPEQIEQMAKNIAARRSVNVPAFYGRLLEPEVADTLNKMFAASQSTMRRWIASRNSDIKGLVLAYDFGVGQLQGLVFGARHPLAWAKAQGQAMRAFLSPEIFPVYVRENLDIIREMAQNASSVGRLPEMMGGLEPGQFLTKARVLGAPGRMFARQFQTFLDVAKIEAYKAWRNVTPPDQRLAVIRTIESQLSLGRMESGGMADRQALIERLLLLASSYYRGSVNLIAAMAEPGVSGRIARQSMSAYWGSAVAGFVGVGLAIGMTWDEIVKRLNPANSSFLMWTTAGEEGRTTNIGLGGMQKSIVRFFAKAISTTAKNPENWKSLSSEKNPVVNFYRAHSAPLINLGWTAFGGRDFMGNESDIGSLGGGLIPLTAQQALFRQPGEPPASSAEIIGQFLGLSAWTESIRNQFIREREELSQSKYKGAYASLPLWQQVEVTKELQAKPVFAHKQKMDAKLIGLAIKSDAQRQARVNAGLTEPNREKLAPFGVVLPSYDASLKLNGVQFPLTEQQQQRYEALIIEQYNNAVANLNTNKLQSIPADDRQDELLKALKPYRDEAKKRLLQELQSRK